MYSIFNSCSEIWEQQLKLTLAHVAKSFSRRQTYTLSRAEDLLHKKRSGLTQKLNADLSLHPVLDPQLKIVEAQLASLQLYHVDTLALRSDIGWREQPGRDSGRLFETFYTLESLQEADSTVDSSHSVVVVHNRI
ncbi:hypothetical protein BD408DRAFT_436266 [Parasitella parasitica]|nr:hypothetical protein BD408DRAFT_436266 [Parasitella parasitica]